MAEDEDKKTDKKEEKETPSITTVEGEKKEVKKMKPVKIKKVKPKTEEVDKKDEEKTKLSKEKKVKSELPKKKVKKKKVEAEKEKPKKEVKAEKPRKELEKPKVKDELKKEKGEKAKEEEEEIEEEEAEKEEAETEEIEIIEEEEEYTVKIKPELSRELKHNLKTRRSIKKKTPDFRRQEWFRYKRLGTSWRRPRGLHSKMRKHKGYRLNVVSVGYGSPIKTRNLHPSGFEEVMVYNIKDLEKIDPKSQAARVGHSVGTRKRIKIEEKAEEKGIRVLNPRGL
jgi:large subunit ribosomal protein L32e